MDMYNKNSIPENGRFSIARRKMAYLCRFQKVLKNADSGS